MCPRLMKDFVGISHGNLGGRSMILAPFHYKCSHFVFNIHHFWELENTFIFAMDQPSVKGPPPDSLKDLFQLAL